MELQPATREHVAYIQGYLDTCGITATAAQTERLTDCVQALIWELGMADARPVFTTDGTGPWCSWCWSIAGICECFAHSEIIAAEVAKAEAMDAEGA